MKFSVSEEIFEWAEVTDGATSADQRQWVGAMMRRIGVRMGLQLAVSMADLLLETEIQDLSFSNCETFLIGEWYPN